MASLAKPKGKFTIQCAGVLLVLSGLVELFSLTAEVPLFGDLRGGAVAVIYHAAYLLLFSAMGFGLLALRRWGYSALLGGTVFYTLDKALWILDRNAQHLYVRKQLDGHQDILVLIGEESLPIYILSASLLFLASWWGFALYVYFHRKLFQPCLQPDVITGAPPGPG